MPSAIAVAVTRTPKLRCARRLAATTANLTERRRPSINPVVIGRPLRAFSKPCPRAALAPPDVVIRAGIKIRRPLDLPPRIIDACLIGGGADQRLNDRRPVHKRGERTTPSRFRRLFSLSRRLSAPFARLHGEDYCGAARNDIALSFNREGIIFTIVACPRERERRYNINITNSRENKSSSRQSADDYSSNFKRPFDRILSVLTSRATCCSEICTAERARDYSLNRSPHL